MPPVDKQFFVDNFSLASFLVEKPVTPDFKQENLLLFTAVIEKSTN